MDPVILAILLLLAGVTLLFGDLFVPSAGLLSVAGVGMLLGAIILCFTIDRWLGLGVTFAGVVTSPLVGVLLLRAWRATPVGRGMVLEYQEPRPRAEAVRVGQVGRTLSSLRPMGECEFASEAGVLVVQCKSETGDLPPGRRVQVAHFKDGLATVRPAPEPPAAPAGVAGA